ncbi:hypothetical protein MUP77_09315 [Candidatus Bathyarchaeota archaeon]|nr:hypothetical protein [Candidatus Bathyarchaeota archaeon]
MSGNEAFSSKNQTPFMGGSVNAILSRSLALSEKASCFLNACLQGNKLQRLFTATQDRMEKYRITYVDAKKSMLSRNDGG